MRRTTTRPSTRSPRGIRAIALLGAASAFILGLAGCDATPDQLADVDPGRLAVPAGSYDDAFEAAIAAARDLGMTTVVRDPRTGLIVTEPRLASTMFEPWGGDNVSVGIAVENTLQMQRRRIRVEFVEAAGGAGAEPAVPPRLEGPDILGMDHPRSPDLSAVEVPTEMRVWVFLERAHTPGVQRSRWSQALNTRWTEPRDPLDRPDIVEAEGEWTAVSRDTALEARFVEDVRNRVG